MSEEQEEVSFIFTFGNRHEHPNGFVRIIAQDKTDAKSKMDSIYGSAWASQYEETDFGIEDQMRYCPAGCIDTYNLLTD